MDICYITISFPAPSETFACVEIQALRSAGVQVAVRSLGTVMPPDQSMLKQYQLEGIDQQSLEPRRLPVDVWQALRRPRPTFSLVAALVTSLAHSPRQFLRSLCLVPRAISIFLEIATRQPKFVHLFWGHYPSMVAWLLVRFLPRQAWSMSLSAYDLRMDYGLTRAVVPYAKFVRTIAVCNVPSLLALGCSSAQVQVVYHGVDLSALGIASGAKVPGRLVTAGRLVPGKRIADVIAVFKDVVSAFPHATLVIAGDGPERRRLVDQVVDLGLQDATTFLGHVPQSRLFAELQRSEVFVLLSQHERLPNVVKEAMACRCIPVVSPTSGIDELVESGRSGFVVRDNDDAVRAIAGILSGEVDTQSITSTGHGHIAATFDVQKSASALRDLWHRLSPDA